MGTKRVLGRVVVCSAAVIAACFGAQPSESTTAQLVMQANPGAVLFGPTMVNTDSLPQTITLNNTLNAELNTLVSIGPTSGSCPEFIPTFNPPPAGQVVENCDLGSGSGTAAFAGTGTGSSCVPTVYAFAVTFHPTAAGPAACQYTVVYAPSGGGSASFTIQLSGSGMALPDSLQVTPTVISFGDVQVNADSASQPVSVYNNGGNGLTVTGTNTNANFVVTPAVGAPFALASMASQPYGVKCHPTTIGLKSGTLSFSSAAPTVSVGMMCNGIAPTGLTVTPANFPSTLVGRPVDADVAIQNTTGGPVTLQVGFVSAAGAEVTLTTNPNTTVVANNQTVHAILHYTAATERPLAQLATLTIGYQGGPAAQSVAISGEALAGSLGTVPGTTIDFGPVCVGATPTRNVSLYASGLGPIQIISVTPPGAPFTTTSPTGTLQGNHGNMLDLVTGVAPTAAGDLADRIVLVTNIPGTPNQEIKLLAAALPAGVSPTPDTLHFGPGHVMVTTAYKEVIVSNCGATPITFTASRIEGASAAEFALVSPAPTTALDPKGSTKFDVVMAPLTNGQKAAQLILEYAGGTLAIDLDGTGFGLDDVSNAGKDTYYTCSAGGGGASGGASLALLVLVLRRRRRA